METFLLCPPDFFQVDYSINPWMVGEEIDIKLAMAQWHDLEMTLKHLGADEMTEKIATAINNKIDIPFVSEDKEQIFFEKMVDVVTDVLEGLFKGK